MKFTKYIAGAILGIAILLTLGATRTHWPSDPIGGVEYGNRLYWGDPDSRMMIAEGDIDGITSLDVFGQTTNADATATDIWAGSADTAIYVAPTVARIHNITSASATDANAVGTLTFGDNATDGETITIGAKVYTLEDSLTNVDGHVKREAAATDTIDNLIAAINLGAGSGTAYAAATTANVVPGTVFVGAGDTMLLYTETIVATTTLVAGGWGAANTVQGTGANTVIVRGLLSWTTAEVSEIVYMFGVDDSPTTNSYVILNSMEVLLNGGTKINTAILKATAATDGSVSAYITAEKGISHSAIFGISSIQTIHIDQLLFTILGAGTTDIVDFSVLVNTEPNTQLTQFKQVFVTGFVGTAMQDVVFSTPISIAGPAIIKLRALSDTADSHVAGRFAGVRVTN